MPTEDELENPLDPAKVESEVRSSLAFLKAMCNQSRGSDSADALEAQIEQFEDLLQGDLDSSQTHILSGFLQEIDKLTR